MSNTSAEILELWCVDDVLGEQLIDQTTYDVEVQGLRTGHSLMYDPNMRANNDSLSAWCEGAYTQPISGLPDNFGTPGELGACLTFGEEPVKRLPFRCSSQGSQIPWFPLLGLSLVFVARRAKED